jgi:RNA polymerase sigma factor (TIGR02999 family)
VVRPDGVPSASAPLTALLRAAAAGDAAAKAWLFSTVAQELRRLAGREASRWPRGEVRATALVSEVYLRLFGPSAGETDWPNRRYFFAAAARAMHEFMIEQQRRLAARHPPGPLPAESSLASARDAIPIDLIDLRLTLESLERVDPRAAEVFRLRYLLDMTIEEVAHTLALSHGTVERDYRFARIWLRSKLVGQAPGRGPDRPAGNGHACGRTS